MPQPPRGRLASAAGWAEWKCDTTSLCRSALPRSVFLACAMATPRFQAQKLTSGCTSWIFRRHSGYPSRNASTSLIFGMMFHVWRLIFRPSILCARRQASRKLAAPRTSLAGDGKTLLERGLPRSFRASRSQSRGPESVRPIGISMATTAGTGARPRISSMAGRMPAVHSPVSASSPTYSHPARQPSIPSSLTSFHERTDRPLYVLGCRHVGADADPDRRLPVPLGPAAPALA